jgi:hypothetical protein
VAETSSSSGDILQAEEQLPKQQVGVKQLVATALHMLAVVARFLGILFPVCLRGCTLAGLTRCVCYTHYLFIMYCTILRSSVAQSLSVFRGVMASYTSIGPN